VMVFAVPGDLASPTGGYAYDRRIIAELRALGRPVEVLGLGEGFPRPPADTKKNAGARLAALPSGTTIVIDGLALGVLPEAAAALHASHRLIALVHHPLALETGLPSAEAAALQEQERTALSFAHRVITTSATTARTLVAGYAVPDERIAVVQPGTERPQEQPARAANADNVTLLAVGSVVPRKGYDVLLAALGKLAGLRWRLLVAGDNMRDPATAQALDADIVRLRLSGRVTFLGAVSQEQLSMHYAAADLFVLPSRYEGFGMAFTEAIAHGVPVVGTTAGAIPEAVPAGAGVLVPPDDIDALADVLRRLIERPDERARLAAGARAAADGLMTWEEAGRRFVHVLDEAS
jgi:glycosyltransferase involved in cell wall biosynthesis